MTKEVTFTYINYRQEISVRRIRAEDAVLRFTSTKRHPEMQLILRAFDLDKNEVREFALSDIYFHRTPADFEEDFYVDDNETEWRRPTAHAYAMVCKARDKWHGEAKRWGMIAESALTGDDDVVRQEEDLPASVLLTLKKTRDTRDRALLSYGEVRTTLAVLRAAIRKAVLDFWTQTGFRDYVLRNHPEDSQDQPVEAPRVRTTAHSLRALFIMMQPQKEEEGEALPEETIQPQG